MTSQLNVDTIVDKAGSGGTNVKIGNTSTYVSDGGSATQNTVQGLLKAWLNMDGSGTIAITDSFNIGSITDIATGDYFVNLSNAMANSTWCVVGSSTPHVGQSNNVGVSFQHENNPLTTTRCRPVTRRRDNNTDVDVEDIYLNMSGDLA